MLDERQWGAEYKVNNVMRGLRRASTRFLRGQAGLTLVETIVAVGILALLGTSILTVLETSAENSRELDEKVVATNLATAYFEAVKALPYAASYPSPENLVAVPPQYSVDVDITFSSDGSTGDGITWVDTYNGETIQKISLTISRDGGEPILTVCAFKTKRVEV